MSSGQMIRKSITLPKDLAERIEALSEKERRSFSAQMAKFAEEFFERETLKIKEVGNAQSN
jgi:predicted transcriptional regulator